MKRSTALAVFILALTVMAASGQTYTELLSFDGNIAAAPETPLTQGVDGNLYGTTFYGGTGACRGSGIGCGIVFKLGHSGTFDVLYNFPSTDPYPISGLVLGLDGNLYGETGSGSPGTIFKITPTGDFSTLYSFRGSTDGYGPSDLFLASDGNFYGVTVSGGTPSNSCPGGCGTIFKMSPSGSLTTLYSFCPQNYCPDGEYPSGALAEGLDGNLYGTTNGGGLYKTGTIFRISRTGVFRLLYTFSNFGHGSGLILANDGNLYGRGGNGVYQLTPQGVVTVLPGGNGGYNLFIQASDGNFYGTSQLGGTSSYGYIFSAPIAGGNFSDLYNFLGYPNDGSSPFAGVIQHTNGLFYGGTSTGGNAPCNYGNYPGCGTVYSLDMGLPPFVTFLRGAGGPGRRFGILGQNFTGATAVSLNGTPVDFKVRADTFIAATVPAGATTGYVTVTTSGGKLKSNVPFRVLK